MPTDVVKSSISRAVNICSHCNLLTQISYACKLNMLLTAAKFVERIRTTLNSSQNQMRQSISNLTMASHGTNNFRLCSVSNRLHKLLAVDQGVALVCLLHMCDTMKTNVQFGCADSCWYTLSAINALKLIACASTGTQSCFYTILHWIAVNHTVTNFESITQQLIENLCDLLAHTS